MFCRYTFVKNSYQNVVLWKCNNEKILLNNTHYIFAGSGREEEKVLMALHQYTFGEAKLTIVPYIYALCLFSHC
jgi:hypothetical protein